MQAKTVLSIIAIIAVLLTTTLIAVFFSPEYEWKNEGVEKTVQNIGPEKRQEWGAPRAVKPVAISDYFLTATPSPELVKETINTTMKSVKWNPLFTSIVIEDGREIRILTDTRILIKDPGGSFSVFPILLRPGMTVEIKISEGHNLLPIEPKLYAQEIIVR